MVDTGDALAGGGSSGDATLGEVVVEGMNLMGYDAMALGPKELSLGFKVLSQRIAAARFAVLSANVISSQSQELFARPYVVVERAGRRIGLIGLTAAPPVPAPGFEVTDAVLAAADLVPLVRHEAEIVVILTNLSYREGRALAAAVPGIDLVIAARPDQLPAEAVRIPGTETLLVSAEQPVVKHTGRRVGRLQVTLEAGGSLGTPEWQSIPMTPDLVDDPEMAKLLERFGSRP